MKSREKYFLITLLLIFLILKIIAAIQLEDWDFFLWFCFFNLVLLTFALYFENDFLTSAVLTSSFFPAGIYAVDIISFAFFHKLVFGVATYLPTANLLVHILTYYHILLIVIPIYVLYKKRTFHHLSWIFSSLSWLFFSFIVSAFVKSNINCALDACNLGLFNFVYNIHPLWMPFFIFNWIVFTLAFFIPANYLFYFLFNRKKKIF